MVKSQFCVKIVKIPCTVFVVLTYAHLLSFKNDSLQLYPKLSNQKYFKNKNATTKKWPVFLFTL